MEERGVRGEERANIRGERREKGRDKGFKRKEKAPFVESWVMRVSVKRGKRGERGGTWGFAEDGEKKGGERRQETNVKRRRKRLKKGGVL